MIHKIRFFSFRQVIVFVVVTCIGCMASGSSVPLASEQALAIRALHIVSHKLSVVDAKRIIDAAHKAKFNTLVLGIAWKGSTKLDNIKWTYSVNAWSKRELSLVADYAKYNGLEVIPHIPLLSHADNLFNGEMAHLLYNRSTYDPSIDAVYNIIFPLLDEIIDLLKPKAIHVGHDEVWGWKDVDYHKGRLGLDEVILPAELFLNHIIKVNKHLNSRGVRTWMWGDMLISREEFSGMKADSALHGGIGVYGYGAQLRHQIPRNIVVCDWHYRDDQKAFPSLGTFVKEGFHVVGATWVKPTTVNNFAYYASQNQGAGMLASTWYLVQRKDWKSLYKLIANSGRVYEYYFPD